MDHKLIMKVMHGFQQLTHNKGCFGLGQALSTLDHLVHTLIVTQLQQDITVLAILKEMFVLTHMPVLERAVNLNFRLQLKKKHKIISNDKSVDNNIIICKAAENVPFDELWP
jgi:hypothetical protein